MSLVTEGRPHGLTATLTTTDAATQHAPAPIGLDAVRARCDHPTAEDIFLDVRTIDERVSRGTVYRNLNLLAETGVIATVKAPGAMRFDRRCDSHGHVVCRSCGVVADAPLAYDASLDAAASQATGFAIDSHIMVFEGLCPHCAAPVSE